MKTRMMIVSFACLAMTAVTMGQTSVKTSNRNGNITRPAYVDKNKNGVCDNYEARHTNNTTTMVRYGQGQHRGKGKGVGCGHGSRFVDKNHNGICDYRETVIKK
ncbi:hypothetical protein [Microbacter margulisiae]|uniref:Uncharacterized protein n=1 Tax=Microbacter margulisiae TaxID=1350067 RepID=A0A7W5DQ64_9PORP|nr:hypothetical protein [Microbacter margulisiae]MBB3186283.1 hypothetical protein [Microbacter margulisiae]